MVHEADAHGTKARVPLSRRPPRVSCGWRGHGRVQDKERFYLPQVLRLRRKGYGRHVAQGAYKGSGGETVFVSPLVACVVYGGSFCATNEKMERVSQVMLEGKALGWVGVSQHLLCYFCIRIVLCWRKWRFGPSCGYRCCRGTERELSLKRALWGCLAIAFLLAFFVLLFRQLCTYIVNTAKKAKKSKEKEKESKDKKREKKVGVVLFFLLAVLTVSVGQHKCRVECIDTSPTAWICSSQCCTTNRFGRCRAVVERRRQDQNTRSM